MMRILDLLYPPLCPLCGRTLRRSLDTFPLCEACAAELQSIKGNGLCEPQEVLPDNVGLYYAYRYTGLLREAVLRYKYKGALWMAEPFAELFHKRMLESGGYDQFDLAAYVPVSGRSLAVRGYDQTLEIVKRIAKKSGLQYVSCLYKKDAAGDNAADRKNRSERNQEDRYGYAGSPAALRNRSILLIDDILTTGATLRECTRILLRQGAGCVFAAVFATGRRDI